MWSGTFYSFAICSHSCLPFVFNLPVFTFSQGTFITEAPTNCLYESPPELRFHTYASHLFCTILHYFALHRTAMIPPSLLATIHLETIPYPQIAPPQSPIGFILRSLLHPRHIILEPTARGYFRLVPSVQKKKNHKPLRPSPYTAQPTPDNFPPSSPSPEILPITSFPLPLPTT